MKSLLLYVIGLAALATASMSASAQNYLAMPEQIILTNPMSHFSIPNQEFRNDLWTHGIMPEGRYRGEEMNFSERRPPVVLDGNLWTHEGNRFFSSNVGTEIAMRRTDVKVINIEHMGKQYLALIDIQEAHTVYASFSSFQLGAAHFFTMIDFEKPDSVRLIGEVIDRAEGEPKGPPRIKMLDEPIKLRSLVVSSIEGTMAKGRGGYDLMRGLQNEFTNVYKITTAPSRLQEWVRDDHPQILKKLNATPDEAKLILTNNLWESDRAGINFMYNTWNSNCTNRGMEGLERGFGRRDRGTFLQRAGRLLGATILNLTSLSQNYPILTKIYGLFLRGYRDMSVGPIFLHQFNDPALKPYIDELLKQYPNSKAHKAMEDIAKGLEPSCDAAANGEDFGAD